MRGRAADALANINDTRSVEPLIQALKDEESYVQLRARAEDALVKIGKPAVEPLIRALKDEDSDIRGGAAFALGDIHDTSATEPLIEALKDKDIYVRGGVAYALGNINDTRAVEPLIQALKDEDDDVQWKGMAALAKIGKPAVGAADSGSKG